MKWNSAMRKATVAQFGRLIKSGRRGQVENAIAAGRSLAKLLLDGRVILIGVDDLQLERYRRRFGVPMNLKGIMYAIATRDLDADMLNIRLDRHFPHYTTLSGKRRLVKRCALCAKRTCRCFDTGLKNVRGFGVIIHEKRKKAVGVAPRCKPVLVSVRGIPVQREAV